MSVRLLVVRKFFVKNLKQLKECDGGFHSCRWMKCLFQVVLGLRGKRKREMEGRLYTNKELYVTPKLHKQTNKLKRKKWSVILAGSWTLWYKVLVNSRFMWDANECGHLALESMKMVGDFKATRWKRMIYTLWIKITKKKKKMRRRRLYTYI